MDVVVVGIGFDVVAVGWYDVGCYGIVKIEGVVDGYYLVVWVDGFGIVEFYCFEGFVGFYF